MSDEAKAAALEKYRDWNVEHFEWWDFTYDDAKRMGALMGIQIDDISFTGFWSQGDGASFTGTYACEPEAVQKITSECGGSDETLIAIATELTLLQTTLKMQHGITYDCTIRRHDTRYSHSNTMSTGYNDEDFPEGVDHVDIDHQFERLMRDFAGWIYKSLEAEHEYLTSDEAIIESCFEANDLKFSSTGEILRA